MQRPSDVGLLLPVVSAAFMAWFVWLLATQCDSSERGKMSALFFLIVTSTVFWSMFEQSGGSMTLFAERATDLSLFGLNLTAAQFGSANAIFIIILSPLFALLWPACCPTTLNRPHRRNLALGSCKWLGFWCALNRH